jgi:hypothetical protein
VKERGGNQLKCSALRRRLTFGASLAISAAALFGACDDSPAARSWPPGTLLAVDDVPITSEDIGLDVSTVLLIEPQWGDAQLKRLAFNNIALPRALARASVSPKSRDEARRALDERYARTVEGKQFGPVASSGALGEERSGTWTQVGIVAWGAAMLLQPGEWSEVIEEPGSFLRVRLLERDDPSVLAATSMRIDVLASDYIAPAARKPVDDEALSTHRLSIVDPAWQAIVPERTKYLMRANP